jgi:hypothetical protein
VIRAVAAAAVAAGALALAVPAQAAELPAACRANASKVTQADPLAPLVVGDSVTVAAGRYLGQAGFAVDAVACRMWIHGLEVLSTRRLPDMVVVALGSNGVTTPGDLERALELVGPFARLVLVLPKALGGRADPDGRLMRSFAEAHPDQVAVLDWPAYSAGQGGWFAPDGLHLTTPGAEGFARMIAEGVEFAPAERAEPAPDDPPAERRRPRAARPQPAPSPIVAELWRMVGGALAVVVRPVARMLEPLLAPRGGLGRQDL